MEGMFSAFDPDLKVTVKEGKVFDYHTTHLIELYRLKR